MKRMSRRAASATIVALLLATPAIAKDKTANFVNPAQLDLTTLLVAPPTNDSAQTKAELAEVHAAQANASPERAKQAAADSEETVFQVIGPALGPAFSAERLPLTAAFFVRVLNDEGLVVDPAKEVWKRPRPPFVDPEIKPCGGKVSSSGAYPSGHATVGYLTMIVLSDMLPEKRAEIQKSALRFAESRIICGVHYPSDVMASRTVAAVMAVEMRANPQFKKEFAAARAEARAALGLAH